MFTPLQMAWRKLKEGKPGSRFQDRFDRHSKAKSSGFNFGRVVNIFSGVAVALVGVIFLPAPGPGSVVLIIGLSLLASEIRFVARFLDWSELSIRKAIGRIRR